MSAPQVTPADVEATIASEHYFTAGEGVIGAFAAGEFDSHGSDVVILRRDIASTEVMKPSLNLLTFCVLVLKNGHLVTGEAMLQDLSKPDPERARASARRRAFDKTYDMMVYAERERLPAKSLRFLPLVRSATPEQLAELREAMRDAHSMPMILEPDTGITWTVLDDDDPTTLPPAAGDYLVTVETDSGRETHVLAHTAYGKWMHEGEFTFRHGYYFRPIAWAPRPAAYAGEVPA